MSTRTWKIGAVATASGLSVRTLHHWDAIGLLSPSLRANGGHREYTEEDLAVLYTVITLRGLGLGLDSIRSCLTAGIDPHRLLADHLTMIETTLTDLAALRDRVTALAAGMADDPEPDAETILDVLRLMRRNDAAAEVLGRHLDEDELAALAVGAASVGPARHYLLEVEWPQLYRTVDALRQAGAAPSDPRVLEPVRRMAELSALFADGRSGAGRGVRAAWRDDPAVMSGQPDAPVEEWRSLGDFVEQVRAVIVGESATSGTDPAGSGRRGGARRGR